MARRLNIERRRKRIRHYTAKRRLRSPLHRAVLYWWGPLLLFAVTAALLVGPLVRAFDRENRVGVGFGRAFFPPSGLRLVRASEADVAEVIRAGNVKRLADALSDEDVGISMDLPVAATRALPRLPLIEPRKPTARPGSLPYAAFIPKAMEPAPESVGSAGGLLLQVDGALGRVAFATDAVGSDVHTAEALNALFEVALDDDGRVMAVFRIRPAGEETETLRRLRRLLEHGHGNGAASGKVWFSTRETEIQI